MVVPFIWMLLGSFKPTAELRQVPPTWWPVRGDLRELHASSSAGQNFRRFFFNSAVVAVAVTLGNLLFCSMLGYALAKLRVPGQADPVPAWSSATLMVPGVVTFMPLFIAGEQPGPGEHPRRR